MHRPLVYTVKQEVIHMVRWIRRWGWMGALVPAALVLGQEEPPAEGGIAWWIWLIVAAVVVGIAYCWMRRKKKKG